MNLKKDWTECEIEHCALQYIKTHFYGYKYLLVAQKTKMNM